MIHKYKINDINIVLDVNSGSVHVVDNIAYDLLDYYKDKNFKALEQKYTNDDISEAVSELDQLVELGMLFSDYDYDAIQQQVETRNPVVKAMCLHVAHDCNLKCKYCFAHEGEYNGKRAFMDFETGKAAIDFLVRNSGSRRSLEIDFFGGEPLMNFEVVKQITEYAISQESVYNKKFRFTITTNGLLLDDEIESYINQNMQNIVLSIDGRKSINDIMRIRAGGQGTYDVIIPKFQKLAESRKQTGYYVRGTFTSNNLDFSEDVIHLAKAGFKQISVEPVVAADTEGYAIRQEHLNTICQEYENLAERILAKRKVGNGFNFFHFMIDLTGGPCVAKRLTGCGAGTEYLAVTPEGDLYPCHQFVGTDQFKMGHVSDNTIANEEVRKSFDGCNLYAKDECKSCFAKFYCGGGCAANAYNSNGNIMKPYEIGCHLQRKRTECALYIKAVESF